MIVHASRQVQPVQHHGVPGQAPARTVARSKTLERDEVNTAPENEPVRHFNIGTPGLPPPPVDGKPQIQMQPLANRPIIQMQQTASPPPQCSGIYSDSRDVTSDPDHDLDKDRHAPDDESPDIVVYDNVFGESGARSDYYLGFFAGTAFESTSDDDTLYNHFMTGDGSRLNFSPTSDMARILGGSDDFTPFADGFENALAEFVAEHGTLCGFDGDSYVSGNRPGYFHDPLFAWAVMGGYSRLEARVTYDTSSRTITVTYKIYDHYGAGVSDAWSALPGLSALYYLQHFHGTWGTAYTPFIWSVEIRRRKVVT